MWHVDVMLHVDDIFELLDRNLSIHCFYIQMDCIGYGAGLIKSLNFRDFFMAFNGWKNSMEKRRSHSKLILKNILEIYFRVFSKKYIYS